MKAIEILKDLVEECNGTTIACYDTWNDINEAIAELEALQQPKSCDGCKYQMHTTDDVQSYGNWMKYSVCYVCVNDKTCKRNTADRYEPKEQ